MTQMDSRNQGQLDLADLADPNWKAKTYLMGGLVGAVVGVGAAFLLARSSEKNRGGPPEWDAGELLRLSIAVIGLVRGISALGNR